jgi:hypothetical protein
VELFEQLLKIRTNKKNKAKEKAGFTLFCMERLLVIPENLIYQYTTILKPKYENHNIKLAIDYASN